MILLTIPAIRQIVSVTVHRPASAALTVSVTGLAALFCRPSMACRRRSARTQPVCPSHEMSSVALWQPCLIAARLLMTGQLGEGRGGGGGGGRRENCSKTLTRLEPDEQTTGTPSRRLQPTGKMVYQDSGEDETHKTLEGRE